jgi:hypothetical protein
VKAPKPKKAAWPIEIWPVKPTTMFRPEGGDAEDADLDQQAEDVFVDDVRRKADQDDAAIMALRLVVVGNTVVSAA